MTMKTLKTEWAKPKVWLDSGLIAVADGREVSSVAYKKGFFNNWKIVNENTSREDLEYVMRKIEASGGKLGKSMNPGTIGRSMDVSLHRSQAFDIVQSFVIDSQDRSHQGGLKETQPLDRDTNDTIKEPGAKRFVPFIWGFTLFVSIASAIASNYFHQDRDLEMLLYRTAAYWLFGIFLWIIVAAAVSLFKRTEVAVTKVHCIESSLLHYRSVDHTGIRCICIIHT